MNERFWAKVNKTDSGCWKWTSEISHKGYGRVWWNRRLLFAHRVAYEIENGPIPDGLCVDHLCRNRACVRPDHMELVTPKENVRRGLKVALKTHCVHGHRFEGRNVYTEPGTGWRACRTCRKIRQLVRRGRSRRQAVAIARAEAEEGKQ